MSAPKRNIPRPPTSAASTDAPDVDSARTIEDAATARRDAFAGVQQSDRGMVDALLAERNGYVQRVAMVDEQLSRRGYGA